MEGHRRGTSRSGKSKIRFWGLMLAVAMLALLPLASTLAKHKRSHSAVLYAVADIADCRPTKEPMYKSTADLLAASKPKKIALMGDLAYPRGGQAAFDCYEKHYGQFRSVGYPTPGNHEYYYNCEKPEFGGNGPDCGTAKIYWNYVNQPGTPDVVRAATGTGWYSYKAGDWRIFVLNTNGTDPTGDACGWISCAADSEQGQWLAAELEKYKAAKCTLAYWHHPRFNSGEDGGESLQVTPFWELLQQYNAEMILNGHAHDYERFAPMLPDGTADPMGIRQFVIGTGGPVDPMGVTQPNSEVRLGETPGVMRLTLKHNSYTWEFIGSFGDQAGQVLDSGTGACH